MEAYQQLKMTSRLKSVQVYEILKEELIMGKWQFGEKIHVNTLIEKFQVSRRPVMEALKTLEKEGFIEIAPQYGCQVIQYSKKDAMDILMLRSSTEKLCIKLAIENGTEDELSQLELYQRLISERPEKLNDKLFYLKYNREFHSHIVKMTHSPKISDFILQIWGLNDFYMVNLFEHFKWDVQKSLKEHEKLVELMKAKDIEGSIKAMEAHFEAFMLQHLEDIKS